MSIIRIIVCWGPPIYEDYHLLCLLFKTWGRRDLRDVKGLGDPHLGLYRFSFVCVANLRSVSYPHTWQCSTQQETDQELGKLELIQARSFAPTSFKIEEVQSRASRGGMKVDGRKDP